MARDDRPRAASGLFPYAGHRIVDEVGEASNPNCTVCGYRYDWPCTYWACPRKKRA